MMRLVLNEAAYRDLVAGRVVRATAAAGPQQVPVELILEDIGLGPDAVRDR